jgi:hypothetical protein
MIGQVALTMTRGVSFLYYRLRPLRVGRASGSAMVLAGLGRLNP